MYYTVYKTTNKINGRYYIGAHKTENLDDGYLGSGIALKRAIQKYGAENFEKEILFMCENEEEMFLKEAETITEEIVNCNLSYNMKEGGIGGWAYVNQNGLANKLSQEARERRSKKLSKNMKTLWREQYNKMYEASLRNLPKEYQYDKVQSEEARKKRSESLRKYWEENNNPRKGTKLPDEHKKRIKESWDDKRRKEHAERMRKRMKGNKYNAGKKLSSETRKKMSEAAKKRWAKEREENESS